MKKTIKLTEMDLTNLVKIIIKESEEDMSIIDDIKSNTLKPPYVRKLKNMGMDIKDIQSILADVFDTTIESVFVHKIFDKYSVEVRKKGNTVYTENVSGSWEKVDYDSRGNTLRYQNSGLSADDEESSYWEEYGYDDSDNLISRRDSTGYSEISDYGKKGNLRYRRDSKLGTTVGKKRDRLDKFR